MDGELTRRIAECRDGSPEALDRLLEVVYAQLRRTAAAALRRARPGETLQPTALVHEAYVELSQQRDREWADRQHFFAVASRLMRRVLLRHAERRQAVKRGGGERAVTLVDVADGADSTALNLIELDAVLGRLQERDPFKARVVEQRFFAGLTVQEIADLEGVSEKTVRRAWSFARAWIGKELSAE